MFSRPINFCHGTQKEMHEGCNFECHTPKSPIIVSWKWLFLLVWGLLKCRVNRHYSVKISSIHVSCISNETDLIWRSEQHFGTDATLTNLQNPDIRYSKQTLDLFWIWMHTFLSWLYWTLIQPGLTHSCHISELIFFCQYCL